MRIGLIGLGRMGAAILPRILPVVTSLHAWNRTPRPVPAGVEFAADLQTLVGASDAVFSILADDNASLGVYEQMMVHARPGQIFVEMATVRLDTMQRLTAMVTAQGAVFAEAPLVGTVAPALQGKLLALAGGDPGVLDAIQPVLESFSRRVVRCGPVGHGLAMKHCVNHLMGTYFAALAEALGAGTAAGLSVEQIMDVVMDTPAALPALAPKLPIVLGTEPDQVAYSVINACKDLDVIAASGRANGLPMKLIGAALDIFREAADAGMKDLDLATVARSYIRPER